jgi:2-C-methyl-D-erythritol 4-phosphate cytidylyltransferase
VKASVAAILAAGGRGTRFATQDQSLAQPKQFCDLLGRPIYVWSLTVLLSHPEISRVVIVMPPDMVTQIKSSLSKYDPSGEKLLVTAGGGSRQESVYLGLKALGSSPPEYVVIHDAARPFVTAEMLDAVIENVRRTGACTTGMKPADTVKVIKDEIILETLDRQALLMVQTPQAGKFEWLLDAHEAARKKDLNTTDDAAVLEAAGREVAVVPGSPYNLKITSPADLELCNAIATIVFKDRL